VSQGLDKPGSDCYAIKQGMCILGESINMLFLYGFSSNNLSICRDVIKPASHYSIKTIAPVDSCIHNITKVEFKYKHMIEKNLYVFEHFKSRLYWVNQSFHYPINLMEEKQFCRQFFPDDYVSSAIDKTGCIVYCLTRNAIWAIDLE
jgi:hypothetical protein